MSIKKLIHDESAMAFPTIIGLFCILLGVGLWAIMDEIIYPMQSIYVNTSYPIFVNASTGAVTYYNATTDPYSGYMSQLWALVPYLLALIGIIFLVVQSQREA